MKRLFALLLYLSTTVPIALVFGFLLGATADKIDPLLGIILMLNYMGVCLLRWYRPKKN